MNTKALLAISALEIPPPSLIEQFIRSEETTGTGYFEHLPDPKSYTFGPPKISECATITASNYSKPTFSFDELDGPRVGKHRLGHRARRSKNEIRQYRKRQRQARRKGRG